MNRYVLALVLAALPMLASAQYSPPSAPYLSVKGHAVRSVEPDRFAIDLHIVAVDMKPAAARSRVEQLMTGVLAGFKAHHALPESIDASAISIKPKTDYRDENEGFVGTEVSREAHAVFARLDDLRQFIDSIAADKELQITGTTVTRSDIEKIRQDVRRDAINDSIRAAKSMADAYGVKLGMLYTVSDGPDAGGRTFGDRNALDSVVVTASALPKIDLEVGSIKVEANIFAVYLMDAAK